MLPQFAPVGEALAALLALEPFLVLVDGTDVFEEVTATTEELPTHTALVPTLLLIFSWEGRDVKSVTMCDIPLQFMT